MASNITHGYAIPVEKPQDSLHLWTYVYFKDGVAITSERTFSRSYLAKEAMNEFVKSHREADLESRNLSVDELLDLFENGEQPDGIVKTLAKEVRRLRAELEKGK
jgi:hypothetical protein